jgi:hypothetical protein
VLRKVLGTWYFVLGLERRLDASVKMAKELKI